MVDMSAFIAPKSDQINADDLMGGPVTVEIVGVKANPDSAEQPVSIHYKGDGGRPYKPCKSMRRLMVAVWGRDASAYVGRRMTLYRDADVTFGGMRVGGIRISHMSHLERETTVALTATRAKRMPYTVRPLADPPAQGKAAAPAQDRVTAGARALVERIATVSDLPALEAITGDPRVIEQRAWLERHRPVLADEIAAAVTAALSRLAPPDDPQPASADDDLFPGDAP